MWFSDIAKAHNPGPNELVTFVDNVQKFLSFVLEEKAFSFLWETDDRLRGLAIETFQTDVREAASVLKQSIPVIPAIQSHIHGLSGRALRFKLAVIDAVTNKWQSHRVNINPREWLKRAIDAIDALLDSLIAAAGGAGGLIKEFKDALRALAG
jgi:hypothetical protein